MWNLQTHFMGDFGSCVNEYKLGAPVTELNGVSLNLDGKIDDFIGDCPKCGAFYEFGAYIVKGAVKEVYALQEVTLVSKKTINI